jgi:hypothetical protein
MIWTLFYYNSLPEMPHGCKLISPDVVHRDFLMCNPHNTGHYQYPKFETMSYDEGCHRRELLRFLTNPDPEKYIVFYTRSVPTSGKAQNVLIGYFKVGPTVVRKGLRGFAADCQVLLFRRDAIPIEYKSRGVPVSWGSSRIAPFVSSTLAQLLRHEHDDASDRYRSETRAVMRMLTSRGGWRDLMSVCGRCKTAASCHWGRLTDGAKQATLTRLYASRLVCPSCCKSGVCRR